MEQKKLKLGTTIVVCALTAGLIAVACKKNNSIYNTDAQTALANTNGKSGQIKSRDYNVTGKQVKQLVTTFKQSGKNAEKTSDLDVTVNLPLDSAEFLIEAVINYDFDMRTDTVVETRSDSASFSFIIADDGKIAPSDLLEVYAAMTAHFNGIINDYTQMAVIDVETYIDADGNGRFVTLSVIQSVPNPPQIPAPPIVFTSCYFPVNDTKYSIEDPAALNNRLAVYGISGPISYDPNVVNIAPLFEQNLNCKDPKEYCFCDGDIRFFCWGGSYYNIHQQNTPTFFSLPSGLIPSTPFAPINQYVVVNANGQQEWSPLLYFSNNTGQFNTMATNVYNYISGPTMLPAGFVICDNTIQIYQANFINTIPAWHWCVWTQGTNSAGIFHYSMGWFYYKFKFAKYYCGEAMG